MARPLTTSSTFLSFISDLSLPCEEEGREEEGDDDDAGSSFLVIMFDNTDLMMSLYGKDDRLEGCLLRLDLTEASSEEYASLSFSASSLIRLCLETAVWLNGRSSSFPSPPRGVGEVVLPSAADGRGPCKTVASVAICDVWGARQEKFVDTSTRGKEKKYDGFPADVGAQGRNDNCYRALLVGVFTV